MITLAAFLLAALAAPGEDFEVKPREAQWKQLDARFDQRWTLPSRRKSPGRDLVAEMGNLSRLTFDARDSEGRTLRNFGDLVRAARSLDSARRDLWLESLRASAPQLMADWEQGLVKLLFADRLYSARWDPNVEHTLDGILFAEGWDLSQEGTAPWTELRVRPLAEQAATVVRSDLRSIKEIESDYRHYPSNIGSSYEAIFPVAGSHLFGTDPTEQPFSYLEIYFRCDLPMPFGGYSCDLKILNRRNRPDGCLATHIYSTSKDFHWLAGRDLFFPIRASDDEWVGYLLVRQFGFDLKGVPDKPKHRRAALRSSLGNLRRKSETLFAQRELAEAEDCALPALRVLGNR